MQYAASIFSSASTKASSTSCSPTVLVVEDEEEVAEAMQYKLKLEGMQTRIALNGKDAHRELLREPTPDLVLLDVMLPDLSGLDLCVRIRSNPVTRNVPVIMLTARAGEIDRILGFEVGADDYLIKPFSVRELMLRIQAVLRRSRHDQPAVQSERHAGCLSLDVETHRVYLKGVQVELALTQFKLLRVLMERQGRVLSRDVLLDLVWGVNSYMQTRTVDSHIKQLRKQLGDVGACIESVRGVGYRFVKPEYPSPQ